MWRRGMCGIRSRRRAAKKLKSNSVGSGRSIKEVDGVGGGVGEGGGDLFTFNMSSSRSHDIFCHGKNSSKRKSLDLNIGR